MPYQVKFTDYTKTITVDDLTINNNLSVSFVGKNYVNYAPIISENFLHLLENFANTDAPPNPVQGQLWFDSNANYIKVYDGVQWAATGFFQKSFEEPINPSIGDLWVNPASSVKQLRMFTGSSDPTKRWQLIGPANTTSETSIVIESLLDNSAVPVPYEVVSFIFDDTRVAIISETEFIPKTSLAGFDAIRQGVNLNSLGGSAKFWGVASAADSLISNGNIIESGKLLASDQINTVTDQFNVNSDNGITVGSLSNLSISVNDSDVYVTSTITNQNIIIQTTQLNETSISLCLDSSGNVGVGNVPEYKLDVFGDANIRGNLTVSDMLTVDSAENTIQTTATLTATNIVSEKITPTPVLSPVQIGSQYNFNFDYIGLVETDSFFKGTWVGNSIAISLPPNNTAISEQLVMSVDATGSAVINGWESTETFKLRKLLQSQVGRILRVNEDIPFVYFFAVGSVESASYGCAMYSVIINKMGDIATFTLLSDTQCSSPINAWKNITFFKMSDDPDDKAVIELALDAINAGWEG